MIRTRVGYTGGTTSDPTYQTIGDHSEAIQIDFDPALISYRELAELFWSSHNPSSPPWSTQYKSSLFFHDAEQERVARETAMAWQQSSGKKLRTELTEVGTFYRAEDYHQKYYLRRSPDFDELRSRFDDERAFIDSTEAARANGAQR